MVHYNIAICELPLFEQYIKILLCVSYHCLNSTL